MTLPYLKDKALLELKDQIHANLEQYRKGSFKFLAEDTSLTRQLDLKVKSKISLKPPNGQNYFEPENCITLYRAMANLTPYDARDERIWTYQTHVTFLEYTRLRWPIPNDDSKAIKHILAHFFAGTNRQIERDNAISRLWWIAHLCNRVSDLPQEKCLEAFLYRTDVRANIIERPTMSQSENLFSVIIHALVKSFTDDQSLFERTKFRKIMADLNSIGGFKLLDVLPRNELEKIFSSIVKSG